MSVIDTRKYPKTGIYHVSNLHDVGLAGSEFSHEYLVHRVVEGGPDSGYSSISWMEMLANEFDTLIPSPSYYWIPGQLGSLSSEDIPISLLTTKEIQSAAQIASKLEPHFITPLAASLLSHKNRSWRRPDTALARQDVEVIAEALQQCRATEIEDYSKVTNVVTDVVYTQNYEEVKQMNILLQLLAEHTYGEDKATEGKASKKKGDKEEVGEANTVDEEKVSHEESAAKLWADRKF